MIRSTVSRLRGGVLLLTGALVAAGALGDEPAPPKVKDISKGRIERPAKEVLADRSVPTNRQPAPQPASLPPTPSATANPKVEPGRVRWHPTFDAACAAAQKSGKPVLLFHLMGKLDDQFC